MRTLGFNAFTIPVAHLTCACATEWAPEVPKVLIDVGLPGGPWREIYINVQELEVARRSTAELMAEFFTDRYIIEAEPRPYGYE
jgi:hypothetical protein